jgi:hypothetical protein
MHIKIKNGIPESYTVEQLRRENPQVSFPGVIPDDTLAEYDVYPLRPTPHPAYDAASQRMDAGQPVRQKVRNADGTFRSDDPTTPENEAWEWVQTWVVSDLSQEELDARHEARAEQVRQQRAEAYRQESDPLFFKSQRGEATQAEWLAKVAEIKARFPE